MGKKEEIQPEAAVPFFSAPPDRPKKPLKIQASNPILIPLAADRGGNSKGQALSGSAHFKNRKNRARP
jgi:hypothetical protein